MYLLKLTNCVTFTDGKMYDAYVSYLHCHDMSASSASTFALQVLPEVLENQLGYKMFISGRNELPGEGIATDLICNTKNGDRFAKHSVQKNTMHIIENENNIFK